MTKQITAALTLLLSLSLVGCGTTHLAQRPGTAGFTLEKLKIKAALPGPDNKMTVGEVELPAGTPFSVPDANIEKKLLELLDAPKDK